LDIHASSLEKDVSVSLAMTRDPDGRITYTRQAYRSGPAGDQPEHALLGLHRVPESQKPVDDEPYEKAWTALEPNVYWRGVKTTAQANPDDPGALTSQALRQYAAGNCDASIALAEKAADLLSKQGGDQSKEFATALVVQGLC